MMRSITSIQEITVSVSGRTIRVTLGLGIFWDQLFPEVVRSSAPFRAKILFFLVAISSETPNYVYNFKNHAQLCMFGHEIAI
jgi:hypothetical protein